MIKSRAEIYMDYQELRAKAASLEELANELSSVTESTLSGYLSRQSYWEGDSGDVCREKLLKLEKKLNKRAKELRTTASSLRATAERQYQLEMALASLVSV